MKRRRIGNDINVTIELSHDGTPYPLEGKNLKVALNRSGVEVILSEFTVSGNAVSFTFLGSEQRLLGRYYVTIYEIAAGGHLNTIDTRDVFELVPRTFPADGEDPSGVITESVEVEEEVVMRGNDGMPGASAYEIAVRHGFAGTEEEWLASLKGESGTLNYPTFHINENNELVVTGAGAEKFKIENGYLKMSI